MSTNNLRTLPSYANELQHGGAELLAQIPEGERLVGCLLVAVTRDAAGNLGGRHSVFFEDSYGVIAVLEAVLFRLKVRQNRDFLLACLDDPQSCA